MKISVICPVYNAEPFLCRAVESVFATGYPDLELVMVEDGSTDASLDLARRLVETDPERIKLFQHPNGENRGAAASRNLGIGKSTGELIAFLDADDWYYKNRFAFAPTILCDHPDVDGVYELAQVEFSDGGKWYSNGDGIFGIQEDLRGLDLLLHLLAGKPWPTTAITVRRNLLDKTGAFQEGIAIAEDCHLWFRMAAVGNLVAGDLKSPVTAYNRHSVNTYQPILKHKIDMLGAMLDFWHWCQRRGLNASWRKAVKEGVLDYLWWSVVNLREKGESRLAWEMIQQTSKKGDWPLLANKRILRQVFALMIKRKRL